MNRDHLGRFIKGHRDGMTGKTPSKTHRDNISKALRGHRFWGGEAGWIKKGQRLSPATEFKKGNIPPTKGTGTTPEERKFRMHKAYLDWRLAVLKKDDYTCQLCGKRGGKIIADHIRPYFAYPELRTDIDNGRALCIPCHRTTDSYGSKAYVNYKKQGGNLSV